MRTARMVALALFLVLAPALLAGCGDAGAGGTPDGRSGVAGQVHLGPQCPVVSVDEPCPEEPAAGVTVIVSEQLPGEAYAAGEEVARTKTDEQGAFRVAVDPGNYVVTAEAGMSCELMDATVVEGAYTEVAVPCDTGIR